VFDVNLLSHLTQFDLDQRHTGLLMVVSGLKIPCVTMGNWLIMPRLLFSIPPTPPQGSHVMQSIRMFAAFLKELFSRRSVMYELTRRDFKAGYLGSYLGIVWAFLLPLAMTAIFWFVFQVGFDSQPVDNHPYILWLISGMFPWFLINDCINNGTNAIVLNAFVVKKVAFSIGILPIIKILSSLIIHCFFICLIFIMFLIYGFSFDIYVIQIFYYLFCAFALLVGVTWITSSVVLFFRDLRPLTTIVLQMGFYLTPIFWDLKKLPPSYHFLLKFNPAFYIVQGYRESLIHKVWFWEHWGMTLWFWGVTGCTLVAGAVVFRRLRPHFADVI
jgi:lipopolysaccharide transport system permease protein